MPDSADSVRYVIIQWKSERFEPTPSIQGDHVPQLIMVDSERAGILYLPSLLSTIEQSKILRIVDSLKRSGGDFPGMGRFRVNTIYHVTSIITLRAVIRSINRHESVLEAIKIEEKGFGVQTGSMGTGAPSQVVPTVHPLLIKELPFFGILVSFYPQSIAIQDLSSGDLLFSTKFPGTCSKAEAQLGRGLKYRLTLDEQPYECKVELLEKGTEATSQAVYIHSLGCNPSGIGYFAGTNEL